MALYVLLGSRKTEYLNKMSFYSIKELVEWQSFDLKDKSKEKSRSKVNERTCHEMDLF